MMPALDAVGTFDHELLEKSRTRKTDRALIFEQQIAKPRTCRVGARSNRLADSCEPSEGGRTL